MIRIPLFTQLNSTNRRRLNIAMLLKGRVQESGKKWTLMYNVIHTITLNGHQLTFSVDSVLSQAI